jgi:hypothetical protein
MKRCEQRRRNAATRLFRQPRIDPSFALHLPRNLGLES